MELNVRLLNKNKFLKFNLTFLSVRFHQRGKPKPPDLGKRGSMLDRLIENNRDKKAWHANFTAKTGTANKNIFENIHRPHKRAAVLNSLFVRNITDVLSTSDIAPEVLGYGIEISEVRVSQDYQVVNVFWQVPLSRLDVTDDINEILSRRAPQIRAELISRNVLGKVPRIYFIRDETNEQQAKFEKALQSIDLGPEKDRRIIPNDSFIKNKYSFDSPEETDTKDESVQDEKSVPENPPDMRMNILGLDHEHLMSKVNMAKKQIKVELAQPTVSNEESDLFSKIPGTTLESDVNRKKLLKKFCIDREIMKRKKSKKAYLDDEDDQLVLQNDDDLELSNNNYEEDYFEEESFYKEYIKSEKDI